MADQWYVDYSAKKIDGQTIKQAGYIGAIRYIYAGNETKQTTLDEYNSHVSAGLDVYFVCQAGTKDADLGYSRGFQLGQGAAAEARAYNYPQGRVIFFTNDRTDLPSPATWQAFLDGARDGMGGYYEVGAYGFKNAVVAAVGHAVAFWQSGRRSDVQPFVNFWQDNNYQPTVAGILVDRNLVLKPMPSHPAPTPVTPEDEEDMSVKFVKGRNHPAVFKVEYCHEGPEIAVRSYVPNDQDPGYQVHVQSGGKVYPVDQAYLDAVPYKTGADKYVEA